MKLDEATTPQSRTLTVAAVLVASLAMGGWLIERGTHSGPSTPAEAARLFDDVFVHVYRNYVDSVGAGMLYRKAVDGMLYELGDPYTALLAPDKFGRLTETTSGNYAGVGIQTDLRDGWLVVIAPVAGSPAERAGIEPGDRIIEIDGRSAHGWTLEEATAAFRGKPGTSISIRVERPGFSLPIPYRLIRKPLHQSAVRRIAMLPNGIGYIDIKAFSDSTTRELTRSVNELIRRGVHSIVLDLRGNPGGLLEQGLNVSDMFLGRGQKIVSLRGRTSNANRDYLDSTAQRWPALPLVVLVDDKSASASEIVAGALQDHDRAVLVGEPTYGKGSAQTIIPLGPIGGLKITTSRWYTPSGRSIARRAQRDDDEDAQNPPSRERYLTDSKRVVYGGGGISPDILASDSAISEETRKLQAALGRKVAVFRDALTDYALSLKAKRDTKTDFVVTPAMLEELWNRMVARGIDMPRSIYDESSRVVSHLMTYEIARYVFGPEMEFRRRVANDRAIAIALELATGVRSQRELIEKAAAKQKKQVADASVDSDGE
ncbi:MAG TPA: S41 family peptidase [Gemmatimonadaceae bacterium]|jgi:carboxyl-terminal processing protease